MLLPDVFSLRVTLILSKQLEQVIPFFSTLHENKSPYFPASFGFGSQQN